MSDLFEPVRPFVFQIPGEPVGRYFHRFQKALDVRYFNLWTGKISENIEPYRGLWFYVGLLPKVKLCFRPCSHLPWYRVLLIALEVESRFLKQPFTLHGKVAKWSIFMCPLALSGDKCPECSCPKQ